MNGTQNRRTRNTEKPVPGCLGRVVNIFDLSTRVAGNRLLTDKPHFDGFGHSKRQSDAIRINPIGDALDDEMVDSKLKRSSSRYLNGTPVKMLIAEEMSKEMELKLNSPNLVAKLMGLDTLPQKQIDSVSKRRHSRSYSGSNIGMDVDSWQQEFRSVEHNRYKEFPDMTWRLRKGRVEASNEKKMDLVRQKFAEAKSLSTSEKLRQSKRFQDALEVLSSNRGLFLKLLQEQNSFSHVPLPTETKRITVLRPSKILDDHQIPRLAKNVKPINKALDVGQVNKLEKINRAFSPRSLVNESPTQPTRIVVLKPSGNKPHKKNDEVSLSPFPREHSEEMYGEPLDDDILDSREMSKGITHQRSETLSEHLREETTDSSIFSNGYNGDESSFHKSENEYNLENLSDSEIVTPISTHSWDYIHKFERPCSSSSFSRGSGSAESSVCREAKKRLSERWVLMSSNGNSQEQIHLQRNSSTLGEMLALSDNKKVVKSEEEGIIREEAPLCSTGNVNMGQFVSDSPRNLLRSKSVPATSTLFLGSPIRVSDPKVVIGELKEKPKTTTPKSSFKDKFSSLFFSRNKSLGKDKYSSSQSKHDLEKPATELVQGREEVSEGRSKGSSAMEGDSLGALQGSPRCSSSQDPTDVERQPCAISSEAKLCVAKPLDSRIQGENQDQPSPVSVLEPPLEEDENISTDSSNVESGKYDNSVKSSLICKSPSLESIARTLSWDDPCMDSAISYAFKPSKTSRGSEEEAKGFIFFTKSLLSVAGFDGEVASNSLFAKWNSTESPLNPSLRESCIDMNGKDIIHEAKKEQMRLTRKLVFDCVNTALVEIVSHNLTKRDGVLKCAPSLLVDEVCAYVKKWIPCEVQEELLSDDMDRNSLLVETTVRKEMLGNVWNEHSRLEIDDMEKEIEVNLLEELVQELLVEFSGRA